MITKSEIIFGTREELEEYFNYIKPYSDRSEISLSRELEKTGSYCTEISKKSSLSNMLDKCANTIGPITYLITTLKKYNDTANSMEEISSPIETIKTNPITVSLSIETKYARIIPIETTNEENINL